MPELPEVETIKLSLQSLVGSRVTQIKVLNPNLRWPVAKDELLQYIQDHTIICVRRRSKYLIWDMNNDYSLYIHLGMSGRLGRFHSETVFEPHTHIIFELESQRQIRYRDPRRFGFVGVYRTEYLNQHPRFRDLGVEPLSGDFHGTFFFQRTSGSSRCIKTLIMDSKIVTGIGNIYANEALFHSKLIPDRPADTLSKQECRTLVDSAKQILQKAIQSGGTTLSDFRNAQGEPGYFQQDLYVYQRAGLPCKLCKTEIQYIKLSGRSSFFCPECQN